MPAQSNRTKTAATTPVLFLSGAVSSGLDLG